MGTQVGGSYGAGQLSSGFLVASCQPSGCCDGQRAEWEVGEDSGNQGRLPGAGDICQVAVSRLIALPRESSMCIGQEGKTWAQKLLEVQCVCRVLQYGSKRRQREHSWEDPGISGQGT